jgi:hypothetical protein
MDKQLKRDRRESWKRFNESRQGNRAERRRQWIAENREKRTGLI